MENKPVWNRQALEELICGVMNIKQITPLINKHISELILIHKMDYKEIAQCIVWYDEVFQGKAEPIYGLSFVISVRERAAEYFNELAKKLKEQEEEANKVVENQENNIIFNIKVLDRQKRKPRQLDITEINIERES